MSQQADIVNEHDEVIGQSDVQQILQNGLLHRSVHTFIVDSRGRLFCRQRSFKKPVYPGYWTTSVGAHVMAGLSYDEVATESLRKVLGIHCPLTMIGKARVHDESENEISATYIGYSDERITLNRDESEGGKFLSVDEVKDLIKQKNVTPHLALSLEIYLQYKVKQ